MLAITHRTNHPICSSASRNARNNSSSELKSVALMGEIVTGDANSEYKMLTTFGVQTCTAVALYCRSTKKGALLHIDHNVKCLIEPAIQAALNNICEGDYKNKSNVKASLTGGVWLSTPCARIYTPIVEVLEKQGIQPEHKYWSWCDCYIRSYFVTLNLQTGELKAVSDKSKINELKFYLNAFQTQAPDRHSRFRNRFFSPPPQQFSSMILQDGKKLNLKEVEELSNTHSFFIIK